MDKQILELDIKSFDDSGEFTGYAAAYNNVDFAGDVIVHGAFAESLKRKRKAIPVLWNHEQGSVIGKLQSAVEDAAGLYVSGKLNLAVDKAREVYSLMKNGDVSGMSIGYAVRLSEPLQDGTRKLKKIELFEASIVAVPCNELAQVLDVKNTETEEQEMDKLTAQIQALTEEVKTLRSLIEKNTQDIEKVELNTNVSEAQKAYAELLLKFIN